MRIRLRYTMRGADSPSRRVMANISRWISSRSIAPFRSARRVTADNGGIGGLLLTFDREFAPLIARREEYDPEAFERLIAIAERAGKPLGEFLMEIASDTNFDLLAYRVSAAHDARLHVAGIHFPSD